MSWPDSAGLFHTPGVADGICPQRATIVETRPTDKAQLRLPSLYPYGKMDM